MTPSSRITGSLWSVFRPFFFVLVLVSANSLSLGAIAASSSADANKPATQDPSKSSAKDPTAICLSPNRRKVELHPELPKSDGMFLLLCGDEAVLVRGNKSLHRLPIHVTWDGNADKTPVHPAVKHMEFGTRDIVTVQIDSAGDSERSKLCSQIISVYRTELLAGPGFCREGDSSVRQISSRENAGQRELLVTTIESPEEPTPDGVAGKPGAAQAGKAKLVTNEIWSWHRSEWRMKPSEDAHDKAKYGKDALLLSKDHQYMREAGAPDYWALSPYYVAQKSDSACSIASISMIINAILSKHDRTSDEELVNQGGLIKEMGNEAWRAAVIQGGPGVTLDQLKAMLQAALKISGVTAYALEVIHTDTASNEVRAKLHRHLVQNETSDRNFIIANFMQGAYTGDVGLGHIAPVGAYDEKRKRVLILDPDRQWYEPYWVSEDVFLKGMATQDKASGHARGYVWLQLK